MKHTPGPWIIKDDDLYDHVFTQSKPHRRIACVYGGVKGSNEFDLENQANARLIAEAPDMRELLKCVAMSPIDLENDGECCMRIKTETMFKIASLVFGKQITEIQTLAGKLVTDAAQTSAIGEDHGK